MITKELLSRYREGIATPDEQALLLEYFSRSDHNELETYLNEEWDSISLNERGDNDARSRVWTRLEPITYTHHSEDVIRRHSRKVYAIIGWSAAVAACAGLLVFTGLEFKAAKLSPVHHEAQAFVETVNSDSQPLKISLTDGSAVWLGAKSKIRYHNPFNGKDRSIDLDGEAYFEIARDTAHPFTVHTRSLLVKVLGTSFTVNSFASQQDAQVSVRSGKVAVSVAGQRSDVILLPNERVSFSGKMKLVKELVESPVIVDPQATDSRFAFTSTPIPEIFRVLEEAYQVNIKFDEKTLGKCSLTATLKNQSLFTKLDMICASIGGSYVVEGTEVLVSAPGCNGE